MSRQVIYGLYDPTVAGGEIRYVGYTAKRPETRLIQHLSEAKGKQTCYRHKWINSLLRAGIKPGIVIIEEVTAENWKERESYWIAALDAGRLTNSTSGGEGLINPSKAVREAISRKVSEKMKGNQYRAGIPHSEAGRARISESLRSSERKKESDAARRGRPGKRITEDVRRKIGDANRGRGRPDASAAALKLNEARRGSFWITNGADTRQVKNDADIPEGWRRGRPSPSLESRQRASISIKEKSASIYTEDRNEKIAAARKGGRWITEGTENQYLKAGAPMPSGFAFGRTKRKRT